METGDFPREAIPMDDSDDPGRRSPPRRPPFAPASTFYEYVARGYDLVVDSYDEVEGRNLLSERVRAASRALALQVFQPGDRVLELGCGTGRDAVALARSGIQVVATDVAPGMVERTERRAAAMGVGDQVSVLRASAAQAVVEASPYDGIYSNGAVLNLEPDLEGLARGMAEGLRPGHHAILTAANRISLFELLVYPAVLKPRKAFRKFGDSVPIPVSREIPGSRYVVPTRFYTPAEFLRFFDRDFAMVRLAAFQALTPPWNMEDWAQTFRGAVEVLAMLEDRFGTTRGLRALGAIFLTHLRRRGA